MRKATEFGTGEEEIYEGGDGGEVRWCERRRCRWCGRWMMVIGCEIPRLHYKFLFSLRVEQNVKSSMSRTSSTELKVSSSRCQTHYK